MLKTSYYDSIYKLILNKILKFIEFNKNVIMFRWFQPSNQELIRTIQQENTAEAQKLIATMDITELSKVRDIYISRAICSIRTDILSYITVTYKIQCTAYTAGAKYCSICSYDTCYRSITCKY
ncbi:hypothetical protein RMA_0642 [Rickettsia massiliae MTU5]|uniref:Uncharacterized protein n=1 Tax=Rickettsia massiliae (strain Mtu5) TaxID=416276 RepID=A8F1M9_RICM5|nr:hypothetical protein RMA_0642 [Rickettsia massiliae MTU5]